MILATAVKKTSFSALLLLIIFSTVCLAAQPAPEYQIKAAFLYKFLLFAKWPADASNESETAITIGILGKDPFGDAFRPVEGQSVHGKTLTIRRFEKGTPPDMLKACHLLFISASLKNDMEEIVASLRDYPVLTVSELKVFTQLGGMISFVTKKDTVGFEINKRAAERVGIKLRSKLLRVATRIVEE